MLNPKLSGRRGIRGLSVVEVLIGVAIGLIIIAGVLRLFVTNMVNSRQMLVEARVMQDMRAAADLIARDLRRASYWGSAIDGTTILGAGASPVRNPYRTITPNDLGGQNILYTFSRDATENNVIDNNEQFGFQLNNGAVEMRTASGQWQVVTDPGVMTVNALTVTPSVVNVNVSSSCVVTCTTNCPVVTLRHYNLVLRATAVANANVVRQINMRVRARNDELTGQCPAA